MIERVQRLNSSYGRRVIAVLLLLAALGGYGLALAARVTSTSSRLRSQSSSPAAPARGLSRAKAGPAVRLCPEPSPASLSASPARLATAPHTANSPGLPSSIIRTAHLTVGVRRRRAEAAAGHAASIAATLGGYVASIERKGRHSMVMVVMRVPSGRFDRALRRLRRLGTVRSSAIHGHDVSLEVVDLGARLKNLQIQRKQLLKLFSHAPTVAATIRVQQVLSGVQYDIEQAQARMRYLAQRSTLATISVAFVPRRPRRVHPAPSQLANAFRDAGKAVIGVLAGFIIVLGYAVPFAAVGVVVYVVFLIWRGVALWRKRRTAPGRAAANQP